MDPDSSDLTPWRVAPDWAASAVQVWRRSCQRRVIARVCVARVISVTLHDKSDQPAYQRAKDQSRTSGSDFAVK